MGFFVSHQIANNCDLRDRVADKHYSGNKTEKDKTVNLLLLTMLFPRESEGKERVVVPKPIGVLGIGFFE